MRKLNGKDTFAASHPHDESLHDNAVSGKAWTTESENWFDTNICQVILINQAGQPMFHHKFKNTTDPRPRSSSVTPKQDLAYSTNPASSSWERTKADVQEEPHENALNRGWTRWLLRGSIQTIPWFCKKACKQTPMLPWNITSQSLWY